MRRVTSARRSSRPLAAAHPAYLRKPLRILRSGARARLAKRHLGHGLQRGERAGGMAVARTNFELLLGGLDQRRESLHSRHDVHARVVEALRLRLYAVGWCGLRGVGPVAMLHAPAQPLSDCLGAPRLEASPMDCHAVGAARPTSATDQHPAVGVCRWLEQAIADDASHNLREVVCLVPERATCLTRLVRALVCHRKKVYGRSLAVDRSSTRLVATPACNERGARSGGRSSVGVEPPPRAVKGQREQNARAEYRPVATCSPYRSDG